MKKAPNFNKWFIPISTLISLLVLMLMEEVENYREVFFTNFIISFCSAVVTFIIIKIFKNF